MATASLSPVALEGVLSSASLRQGTEQTLDGLLSSMIRSCYTAGPGQVLLVIDYAQIESRYVCWLAGQHDALERFRQYDAASKEDQAKYDPYRVLAAKVFGVAPESIGKGDIRRHVGKTGVLGCGFGMGRAKFGVYAALQGLDLRAAGVTPKQVIDAYRDTHDKVKKLWRDMGQAAMHVVRGWEDEVYVGKCLFKMQGVPLGGMYAADGTNAHLTMTLPSGRVIWYRNARVEMLVPPYCKMYDLPEKEVPTVTYRDGKKGRISTYGGKLVENATQAGARDLLGQAMIRLEEAGLPTILTVHDEWIGEVPDRGDKENTAALRRAEEIMSQVPQWAEGLPVVVEGFWSKRYRK